MYHLDPEGTFFTGGLSKSFSCGGWRFGFVVTPKHQSSGNLAKALKFKMSETISGVNVPLQEAAKTAYSQSTEISSYLASVQEIFKTATRYMYQRFLAMGLHCPKPMGGFYVFPSFKPYEKKLKNIGCSNSDELCRRLMNIGFFVLSGSNFGIDPSELSFRVACVDFDGQEVFTMFEKDHGDGFTFEHHMPHLQFACDALEEFIGAQLH